jgi:putative phage-type endonuclease
VTATLAPETVGDAVVIAHTDGMGRAEWLDVRRQGIGGSDAPTICGLNEYVSPYELWCEKALNAGRDEDTEAAFWGRTLEPIVAAEAARRENLLIEPVRAVLAHATRPWQLASIDGSVIDLAPRARRRLGRGVYEGKTATLWYAEEWIDDKVPMRYVVQGHHYLAVTGFDWVAYGCLIGGQRLVVRYVERDQALIDQLIELEARFWAQVIERRPPTPDGSRACTDFLNEIRATAGKTVTLDVDEVAPLIGQRDRAAAAIKAAEADKAAAENQLRALLDDAEIGLSPQGHELVTWKAQTRRDIDRDRFKAAGPFLEELATTTTFRVLRPKKLPKET